MTQEFVTLPRHVAEHAVASIEMLNAGKWTQVTALAATLRAALDHPKNHVPDAGNMVPAGWKLVPVEPTEKMVDMGRGLSSFPDGVYRAMLDAAPQPPTTEQSSAVEQPQANQPAMTPIAQRKLDSLLTEGYTISGYSIYHEQKHQHGFITGAGLVGWWKPDGMEYPQPQGEQEPVAWYVERHAPGRRDHGMKLGPFWKRKDAEEWLDDNHRLRSLYAGQPPQGEQEPVAWAEEIIEYLHAHYDTEMIKELDSGDALIRLDDAIAAVEEVEQRYTHPQPPRQPLTDEQIDAIADAMPGGLEGFMKWWGWRQFARAVIEATHNIK